VVRKPSRPTPETAFPLFSPFRDSRGKTLRWYQPSALHRYHELSDGDRLYATLRWVETFGSLARVESSEGVFTLKRRGFLRPYVSVRDAGLGTDLAVLRPNFLSGGTLTFSDGRQLTFTSARFWGFEWSFRNEGGMVICSVRLRSTIRDSGNVVVPVEVKHDKALLVTIAAAYYTMVMANDEAAVIAAGAA